MSEMQSGKGCNDAIRNLMEMIETFISPNDAGMINKLKEKGIKTPQELEDLSAPSFYIAIPAAILMRPDISPEAKIIYAMCVGLTRVKGSCNPTNEYLSQISAIPVRTIQRSLKELHKTGLINLSIERNELGTWRHIYPHAILAGGDAKTQGGRAKLAGGVCQIGVRGDARLAGQSNNENKNNEERINPLTPLKGDVVIPSDLQQHQEPLKSWLLYKSERGERYKPRGLEALWSRVRAIPAGLVKEAVETSMANNWAGIFTPKDARPQIVPPLKKTDDDYISMGKCPQCKTKLEINEESGDLCCMSCAGHVYRKASKIVNFGELVKVA